MSTNVSRRGFIGGTAAAAVLAGLVGCGSTDGGSTATQEPALPSADQYPIDPDAEGTEAKYTTEEVRDGWTRVTNPDGGAELGVMDASKIIQVDGLAFKDMNGNGKLDLYEDWRQPIDDRAKALADMVDIKTDIMPMKFAGGVSDNQTSTDTSAFDLVEQGSRAGVSRLTANPDSYASAVKWINQVEEVCEKSTYGIPYFNYSDPYSLFNVPSSIGIAAAMDKDLWRKAGMWQARAWRASGVRCELGPQIDVYSQPRGTRFNGSVSEDPALNRDFIQAFGAGMQSTWGDDEATDDQGWGKQSCGVMLKHFVGEGSNEGGRDDHSDSGKWDVYPGGNFKAHLVPFLDGGFKLDSKTEQALAVMPNYGIAYDPNDPDGLGEHVGSAYSKFKMSILRNTGWDGMIVTDWMIVKGIPHGVKNLTEDQRLAKLYGNTIDQLGGEFRTDIMEQSYQDLVDELGQDKADELYRDSARRMFKAMMTVDLFENPYSDTSAAKEAMTSEAAQKFGLEAAQKSVIMLKNSGNAISKDGLQGKVYIPQKFTRAVQSFFGSTPATVAPAFGADLDLDWDVVTDTVGEPSGPAGDDGKATPQESDITALTAEDLADVKYAVVKIKNPTDAYQGVEGGPSFMTIVMGTEPKPGPYWKPVSLQYRPYTADGPNVRQESLNPVDELGVQENRSYYGADTYAKNEADLDWVISIKEKLPADAKLIAVVEADRPMIFSELEPYCDAILLGMGSAGNICEQAFADVISGTVEPSGLLPEQMPKDMDTVEANNEDVPRDMDCYTDADGNTYDFCFGLNWSGVIDDDRVKTYKVAPLSEPETEWKADE